MPKSAARAETPGSRNSGLASVASPQGPQAGRGGCLAAGSILLLSLELAAPLAHPLSQRLPPTHPSGRTPHPEQPSVATNDSLDSQGWLALREGLGQGGMHHQPPPSRRSWRTKGPREALAGLSHPAHCSFPYRFSRSVPRRHGHKPFITDWFRGRRLLQTIQLKASSSSCEKPKC